MATVWALGTEPGSCAGEQVLLTAEPPLQPPSLFFYLPNLWGLFFAKILIEIDIAGKISPYFFCMVLSIMCIHYMDISAGFLQMPVLSKLGTEVFSVKKVRKGKKLLLNWRKLLLAF